MKLPVQAQPVIRDAQAVVMGGGSVLPSGICEFACEVLPEPARGICKAAC